MISLKILAESTVQQIHAEDEEKEENWEKRLACSATKPQRSEAVKLLHFTLDHSSPFSFIIILIHHHPHFFHPYSLPFLIHCHPHRIPHYFYRTRVQSLATLVSLVDLIDLTLACEDANLKLIEVVGNSLLQIWELRFGLKAKLFFGL